MMEGRCVALARRRLPSKPHGQPGTWDYRVVRFRGKRGTKDRGFYRVCEVYFNDEGFMDLHCDAVAEGESPAELRKDVRWIVEALGKPVIEASEIQPYRFPKGEPTMPLAEVVRKLTRRRKKV
jgi:hypothetical protein